MSILDCSLRLLVTLTLISSTVLFFEGTGIQAQVGSLPQYEVNALREIADQLGKRDWDFSLNPCHGNQNWSTPIINTEMPVYNNSINCNCSFPGNVCHVESLRLKGQDLDGVLPRSLAKLPYIKIIDLARNYLSGTIPREWASMTTLEYLSVFVNNLSGGIPTYLGNITSLVYLSLEGNMLSGSVPPELGKLENLATLILNANNLSGELPMELNNLSNLKELRLSSNNFTGKIPNLESWSQLEELEIHASGLEGPIPESVSFLSNLIELRISDLSGEGLKFPDLSRLTNMKTLMLRSCNITGKIPDYISNISNLKHLDLSFNNLNGEIPDLSGLKSMEKIYLTGNSLNGSVPTWMITNKDVDLSIDLSYNNFRENTVPSGCDRSLNLYRSYSTGNNSELAKCLRPCIQNISSVHINCGGPRVTVGKKTYEADEDPGGPAIFVPSNENYWGYSSTGSIWKVKDNLIKRITTNLTLLTMKDVKLYTNARKSLLSLTYFGRCLQNGKYTVKLHFAEIVFRDNRSYHSLGRRAFDIYVQGVNQWKNFDIKNEAGGVDKPIIKIIKNVSVTNGTLEIRFHYAGKGTTATPQKGDFGPLISAISMESEPKAPTHGKIFAYAAGVVAVVLCLSLIVLGIAWKRGYVWDKNSREKDVRGLDLQMGVFTYRQIKAATDNFADSNKLGEGGFGSVYKGTLLDGTLIAVKQLSSKSKQGNREFVNEIGMIMGIQHPNVVRLHGFCVERKQLLLVYEYMENNSLAHALFGILLFFYFVSEQYNYKLEIEWPTRQRICVGIAKGLAFLHEESVLRMVHRDIKATNILLDADLTPKISDFGLARLHEEENTHIMTRVAGTIGYMAPEYVLYGYLTYKADVYSFGVLALEIVTGKNNMKYTPHDDCFCLLDWAVVLKQKGSLIDLVDPRLGSEFKKKEALRMIEIALLCTNESPVLRPVMSEVVNMLEGHTKTEEINVNVNTSEEENRFQALGGKLERMQSHEFERPDISINPASSSSNDLYPNSQISQKC
ncbi:probable LRR receptor-like serine/threonine-protein kinase At1g07650 isoform X2 [Lactuca sativa]|uniref:probable LRR receptor-like serine/threonine-protein kinase At1g07650 isoform X2 n=1 Tax=Lactuca sativa TaxID=4236 RepID=UPI000CD87F8F|nr:probable LRR receptor-like serine/threonine-protein kinase At1g07650 isoform X2 [Lactuca sativa]